MDRNDPTPDTTTAEDIAVTEEVGENEAATSSSKSTKKSRKGISKVKSVFRKSEDGGSASVDTAGEL